MNKRIIMDCLCDSCARRHKRHLHEDDIKILPHDREGRPLIICARCIGQGIGQNPPGLWQSKFNQEEKNNHE